jgi:RimJ/RimL family protein N-acetyltransferase
MKAIFCANDYIVRAMETDDLQRTLAVYQQVEDFLALGPVPKASMEMVLEDIQHSKESGGLFCVVVDNNGNQIGVVDFVPELTKGTAFLSLLMISQEFRNQGIGHAIVKALESYLIYTYGIHTIESGVQTNNEPGIRFWKKCGFEIGQTAKPLEDGTIAYDMTKRLVFPDESISGQPL